MYVTKSFRSNLGTRVGGQRPQADGLRAGQRQSWDPQANSVGAGQRKSQDPQVEGLGVSPMDTGLGGHQEAGPKGRAGLGPSNVRQNPFGDRAGGRRRRRNPSIMLSDIYRNNQPVRGQNKHL